MEIYNGFQLFDAILMEKKQDPAYSEMLEDLEPFCLTDPREDEDSEILKIIQNCDLDGNGFMDYWDFLVGTIESNDIEKFYSYVEAAYE